MNHEEKDFQELREQATEQTMLDMITAFAQEIQSSFPEAVISLESFPSFSAMLDIRLHDKLFVMDYSPANGFGVDEVLEEDSFNVGYRFSTEDFHVATNELRNLIESTENSHVQPSSSRSPLA